MPDTTPEEATVAQHRQLLYNIVVALQRLPKEEQATFETPEAILEIVASGYLKNGRGVSFSQKPIQYDILAELLDEWHRHAQALQAFKRTAHDLRQLLHTSSPHGREEENELEASTPPLVRLNVDRLEGIIDEAEALRVTGKTKLHRLSRQEIAEFIKEYLLDDLFEAIRNKMDLTVTDQENRRVTFYSLRTALLDPDRPGNLSTVDSFIAFTIKEATSRKTEFLLNGTEDLTRLVEALRFAATGDTHELSSIISQRRERWLEAYSSEAEKLAENLEGCRASSDSTVRSLGVHWMNRAIDELKIRVVLAELAIQTLEGGQG